MKSNLYIKIFSVLHASNKAQDYTNSTKAVKYNATPLVKKL